jgi:hypothetical protein
MECKKMHSVNNTKFTDNQEVKVIYNFKNTKENFVGSTQLYGTTKYCMLDL